MSKLNKILSKVTKIIDELDRHVAKEHEAMLRSEAQATAYHDIAANCRQEIDKALLISANIKKLLGRDE